MSPRLNGLIFSLFGFGQAELRESADFATSLAIKAPDLNFGIELLTDGLSDQRADRRAGHGRPSGFRHRQGALQEPRRGQEKT